MTQGIPFEEKIPHQLSLGLATYRNNLFQTLKSSNAQMFSPLEQTLDMDEKQANASNQDPEEIDLNQEQQLVVGDEGQYLEGNEDHNHDNMYEAE